MPIAILGTGRSGTSMVARMLNLSGLYMGDEERLWDERLNPHMNPTGYWEQREIHALMDRLFEHLGGTWENPPMLPAGWECDASLDPFYAEAHEIIERVFGGHDEWAWKLPKATVVIAFWKRLIPDLRFLICVRNPEDFAQSLGRFSDNSRSHLFAMWQYYNYHILCETKPEDRLITFYEDYFPGYHDAFRPVLEFAGLPQPVPGSPVDTRISEFIDAELKHYTTPLQTVLNDETIPYVTRRLYQELRTADASASDFPLLHFREMLLPLLQIAVVGEGTLDGTAAVSKAEYHRVKHALRRARWWNLRMLGAWLKDRYSVLPRRVASS